MALYNRIRISDLSSAQYHRDSKAAYAALNPFYEGLGARYGGYGITECRLCHEWFIDAPSDAQLGILLVMEHAGEVRLNREYFGENPVKYSLTEIVNEIGHTLSAIAVDEVSTIATARCWSGVRAMQEMIRAF